MMPIKPENLALYPGGSIRSPEWQAIRAFIRARAGDMCEECGVRHLTYGCRWPDGTFSDCGMNKADALVDWEYGLGLVRLQGGLAIDAPVPGYPRLIRIVCTVAHLDNRLVDHSAANLKFLCQLHHNRLDAPFRKITAARTRRSRGGEVDLVDYIEAQTA